MLIGRADVRATLAEAVAAAEAGSGGLVVLTGEPGIGKTALARWVAGYARDRGATVAWASGWPGEGAPPYWPWVQVLRCAASRATGIAAVLQRVLAETA